MTDPWILVVSLFRARNDGKFNLWFIQRHKVNQLAFWSCFMKHNFRTQVRIQFRMEVGGKVNKPHLQVLIYPGKPLVRMGGNGKEAMFVGSNLSQTHISCIWCRVDHSGSYSGLVLALQMCGSMCYWCKIETCGLNKAQTKSLQRKPYSPPYSESCRNHHICQINLNTIVCNRSLRFRRALSPAAHHRCGEWGRQLFST